MTGVVQVMLKFLFICPSDPTLLKACGQAFALLILLTAIEGSRRILYQA
jgi:hypothetical protein